MIQFMLVLSLIAVTITILKSKWFDRKLRTWLGQESDADDLLSQILNAEKQAERKQNEIKLNANNMKKDLDKLTEVRKTVSVVSKKK
jgi:hypothetical protein